MKQVLSLLKLLLSPSLSLFLSSSLSSLLLLSLQMRKGLRLYSFLSLFLFLLLPLSLSSLFLPLAEATNKQTVAITIPTVSSPAPFLMAKLNSSNSTRQREATLVSSKDRTEETNRTKEISRQNRVETTNRGGDGINRENGTNRLEGSSKRRAKKPPQAREAIKTTESKQVGKRERKQRNRQLAKVKSKIKKKEPLGTLEKVSRRFSSLFDRTPKQSPEELMEEFSTHIEELKSFCSSPSPSDREDLQEALTQLKAFLEKKLHGDPYMDDSIQIKFGDMLDILESLLESPPLFRLDTFLLIYRRHYNIIQAPEEYSEDWVKAIVGAFKCLKNNPNAKDT